MQQNLYTYELEGLSTFEAFNFTQLQSQLESLKDEPAEYADEGQNVPLMVEVANWRNKTRCLCLAFQANPEDLSLINQAIEYAEKSFSACKIFRTGRVLNDELFADILATCSHALAIRLKVSEATDNLDRIIEIY